MPILKDKNIKTCHIDYQSAIQLEDINIFNLIEDMGKHSLFDALILKRGIQLFLIVLIEDWFSFIPSSNEPGINVNTDFHFGLHGLASLVSSRMVISNVCTNASNSTLGAAGKAYIKIINSVEVIYVVKYSGDLLVGLKLSTPPFLNTRAIINTNNFKLIGFKTFINLNIKSYETKYINTELCNANWLNPANLWITYLLKCCWTAQLNAPKKFIGFILTSKSVCCIKRIRGERPPVSNTEAYIILFNEYGFIEYS